MWGEWGVTLGVLRGQVVPMSLGVWLLHVIRKKRKDYFNRHAAFHPGPPQSPPCQTCICLLFKRSQLLRDTHPAPPREALLPLLTDVNGEIIGNFEREEEEEEGERDDGGGVGDCCCCCLGSARWTALVGSWTGRLRARTHEDLNWD